MISGDFDIVYNNEHGPHCLREITPYLNLAETLGAPMIRVCIKTDSDIAAAQQAADEAAERGLQLAHQCHLQSLFETIPEIQARLQEINRPNFGLIFEAANLEQCGQEYGPVAIHELAPWIKNVYLQNQRLHPAGSITLDTWCCGPVTFDLCEIPDSGGIDFSSVFEGLKQIGYDGPITVHQSASQDGNLSAQDSATRTAGFLKSLWRNERNPEERDS
jgi:sugar phosphate isomerase/epimerase